MEFRLYPLCADTEQPARKEIEWEAHHLLGATARSGCVRNEYTPHSFTEHFVTVQAVALRTPQ